MVGLCQAPEEVIIELDYRPAGVDGQGFPEQGVVVEVEGRAVLPRTGEEDVLDVDVRDYVFDNVDPIEEVDFVVGMEVEVVAGGPSCPHGGSWYGVVWVRPQKSARITGLSPFGPISKRAVSWSHWLWSCQRNSMSVSLVCRIRSWLKRGW